MKIHAARDEEIAKLKAEGKTLSDIGRRFNISRERVRIICFMQNQLIKQQSFDAEAMIKIQQFHDRVSGLRDELIKHLDECDEIMRIIEDERKPYLDIPINHFEITAKLNNILHANDVTTLGGLINILDDLRLLKGMGKITIEEANALASIVGIQGKKFKQ